MKLILPKFFLLAVIYWYNFINSAPSADSSNISSNLLVSNTLSGMVLFFVTGQHDKSGGGKIVSIEI